MSVTNGPRRGLMINALTGDNFDSSFRAFLRAIDALLMGNVISKTLSTPPGSPSNGDAYIVAASPTGAWAGQANAIALWTTDDPANPSGIWDFYPAANGMLVYNVADTSLYYWNGTAWTAPSGGGGGAVSSVAGRTGAVVLGESDITSLVADLAATEKTANKDAASGYAGLDSGGLLKKAEFPNLTPNADDGGFWGICVDNPGTANAATDSGDLTVNNSMILKKFVLPFAATVRKIKLQITSGVVGTTMDVGLYNSAGTLMVNTGGFSAASAGVISVSVTAVTLPPGVYYLAFTGTSSGSLGSVQYEAFIEGSVLPALGEYGYTSTTGGVAGVLPSTMPSLTLSGASKYLPITWFGS